MSERRWAALADRYRISSWISGLRIVDWFSEAARGCAGNVDPRNAHRPSPNHRSGHHGITTSEFRDETRSDRQPDDL